MKRLTAYMYPKCSTCRKALKWLEENGYEPEKVNIMETPPSGEELRKLQKQSGVPLRKMFNTSGELYKSMNLKEKIGAMSDDELLELLASHGKLIKRPIVTDGNRTTVGFDEERFAEVWA